MRILCLRTLSKADLRLYPGFDILRSNVTRCFSTQDTKFSQAVVIGKRRLVFCYFAELSV